MWECVWKKSDVTPFVIINIFTSNCNLITIFFLVTVTDYNYFYFVIKLRNSVTPQHWLPLGGGVRRVKKKKKKKRYTNKQSKERWLRTMANDLQILSTTDNLIL